MILEQTTFNSEDVMREFDASITEALSKTVTNFRLFTSENG